MTPRSNTQPQTDNRVLYLVVCAAPPARTIGELVDLLRDDGWQVYVIATPSAVGWIDREDLAARSGLPIRSQPRNPGDPSTIPEAAAVAVVPATFNTINKWAAGISDTFALSILNEAVGLRLPILVSPYVKATLATHPAFGNSLELLRSLGVHLTPTEAIRPDRSDQPFRWQLVADAIRLQATRLTSPDGS